MKLDKEQTSERLAILFDKPQMCYRDQIEADKLALHYAAICAREQLAAMFGNNSQTKEKPAF